ncbi:response regulator transcription factor [Nonomuraea sp. NPDC049649]|uniref:response regulator transcription factor n=1 Tax=Nonomuraea sp. NPDC049649 TaxID=3155776 RepID=UPI00344077E7
MSPSQEPVTPVPVRLMLVEDHDMVAEAIAMALGGAPGLEVVARCGSVTEAVEEARAHLPDVVVLDRRLPDGDGVAAIARISRAAPEARVLVLTGRERETLQLLAEGVSTDQVSERLGVARNTARNHIQRVLQKLGARSKLEAVVIARREGLLD